MPTCMPCCFRTWFTQGRHLSLKDAQSDQADVEKRRKSQGKNRGTGNNLNSKLASAIKPREIPRIGGQEIIWTCLPACLHMCQYMRLCRYLDTCKHVLCYLNTCVRLGSGPHHTGHAYDGHTYIGNDYIRQNSNGRRDTSHNWIGSEHVREATLPRYEGVLASKRAQPPAAACVRACNIRSRVPLSTL